MLDTFTSIVHHPFVIQLGPLPLTGFGIAMLLIGAWFVWKAVDLAMHSGGRA